MKYACLIYSDESNPAANPPYDSPEMQPIMAGYQAFGQTAGPKITAGDALHDTNTATSVRVRDGDVVVTDGPFAETKEQLGGFYVLDCENLDEAIRLAAQIPHASTGTIEVRPVVEFDQPS